MPTIHDLVRALAEREGVEAVVVLGRDGLLIDGRTASDLDGEQLAALAPAIASAAQAIGDAASRGPLVTAVLEFERGLTIASSLSAEVMLLVMIHTTANVGSLLYDLRRHRASIASLV
jgi:predicted regulator of Ras-like GTPase activity (Roadblock/LC7/MglB family)